MKKSSRVLFQSIHFLFGFLLVTTPLVWSPQNAELFEFPKIMFVYAITTLIVAAWTTRSIIDRKLHFTRTKLDPFILAFLLSQIASTIFSIHPRTSIFGYYSRFHGGLLSTLAYITLFYAYVTHFDKKTTQRTIWVLILSLLFSVLYAFPEHFGFAFSCLSVHGSIQATCWVQDIVGRSFGTFGQPNWLAAYIITLFPLLWHLSLKLKKINYVQTGLFIVQGLAFAQLLFTRSKSGFLGFVVSFIIFWAITLAKQKTKALKLFSLSAATILVVAGIIGTQYTPSFNQLISRFSPQSPTPDSATTSAAPTTGTVLDTGDLVIPLSRHAGTKSSTIRRIVWTGSIDLLKHFPLFGTGVETFAYSYYLTRPAGHNLVSEWDFLYNKAHNEFLNFAATTGFPGLITYSLFIVAILFLTNRRYLKSKTSSPASLSLAIASGYTALAISNFFGFSTVAVGVLFFLFPALYLASSKLTKPSPPPKSPPTSLHPLQLIAIITTLGLTSYLLLSLAFQFTADVFYQEAQKHQRLGEAQLAAAKFQQAIRLRPQEPTFRNDYADLLAKIAYFYTTKDQPEAAARYAQSAIEQSIQTLEGNPSHLNFYKTQAGVFIRLSVLDPQLLDQAEQILTRATKLSPTEAKLFYNLGLIYLDKEDLDQSITNLIHAIELKPDYESARLELAKVYIVTDQPQKAAEQYQFILDNINPASTTAQNGLSSL